ncbi:hypothetical protein CSPX01_17094 [Colletotrichum filicis]|nr:hypothetical protein CSPX01_17094 [Colletotrichum filicis]
MIIRYLDKGVMTTDKSPLSPSVLKQSRSLSVARDSFVLENTADTRAEVLVGSTTEKALNEPSGGQIHKDSNGESCRKAAAPTTRSSTAMQAYLVPPTIDLSAKTQATSKNNIQEAQSIISNIAKATMPVAEKSHVCAKGDVELGHEATVDQSDEQFLAPELSAVPPFQRSESIIDFIARVEQEVLGPESLGYVDNPSDEARIWQHDDRLGAPSDTFREARSLIPQGVSINQPLTEPGRRRPEDAFDRMEEELSEIRYHGERPDQSNQYWEQQQKQAEDDKYDKDEKEEMLAFWRPNYFH